MDNWINTQSDSRWEAKLHKPLSMIKHKTFDIISKSRSLNIINHSKSLFKKWRINILYNMRNRIFRGGLNINTFIFIALIEILDYQLYALVTAWKCCGVEIKRCSFCEWLFNKFSTSFTFLFSSYLLIGDMYTLLSLKGLSRDVLFSINWTGLLTNYAELLLFIIVWLRSYDDWFVFSCSGFF